MQTASQGAVILCLIPPLTLRPEEHIFFFLIALDSSLVLLFYTVAYLSTGNTDDLIDDCITSLYVLGSSKFKLLLCFFEMLYTGQF